MRSTLDRTERPTGEETRRYPHLHKDWAHPRHICIGTGLTLATSAPGLGSPSPQLRRDWAHPSRPQVTVGAPFSPPIMMLNPHDTVLHVKEVRLRTEQRQQPKPSPTQRQPSTAAAQQQRHSR